MKKNIKIILQSDNIEIIDIFVKKNKKNTLIISENINYSEKFLYNNIILFPKINNYDYDHMFKLLNITNNKIIESLIIDTTYPINAELFFNININEFIKKINDNIFFSTKLINNIIKLKENVKIFFVLHREKKNDNPFLLTNKLINNFLLTLSKNILSLNKNINITFLSTENLKLNYKKEIYPFRKQQHFKKNEKIIDDYNFFIKKELNKHILIL